MGEKRLFSLAETNSKELVGGKSYALSKLIHAGFNVPDGFVVPVDMSMRMTPKLRQEIMSFFDKLKMSFVAVRSSAISEDGLEDAWAGQLDTFLNCRKDNLIESIERCWKSATSSRALSYAKQKGISSSEVAVIVQKMIQGEVSGVAFSAHPVTSSKNQIVIEAGLGLGEAVVSGQITPDTYITDKNSGQIIEKHISQQKKKLVKNAEGANTWEEIGLRGNRQKLTNEQILKIQKQTIELEAYFGFAVDVEWTISQGKIYILQSRPITTLHRK